MNTERLYEASDFPEPRYQYGRRLIHKPGKHPFGWAAWAYEDTGEPFSFGPPQKPCPACGREFGSDGHDPCIANLPGVVFACCGHGAEQGYLVFSDGRTLRFKLDCVSHKGKEIVRFNPS